jgi:hypothetical protein
MNTLDILCNDFGRLTGIDLDLSAGAARLDRGAHGPWWIEVDGSQRVLTLYHTVGHAAPEAFEFWLALNCRLDLLGGAWLAYHQPTESIRLCLLYEVARLDGASLITLLDNLQRVRDELPMPAAARAAPQPNHLIQV